MLRLLKSKECANLTEAAQALGYSWRQCQRWFASYTEGGLEELLKSRVGERGRQELVTPEAFEELEEAMKKGEIATISQADGFLRERHGIHYVHPDGVGQLLRRRKVKLKAGRPRHEKADQEEQETFKKTSPTISTCVCAGSLLIGRHSHTERASFGEGGPSEVKSLVEVVVGTVSRRAHRTHRCRTLESTA